MAVSSCTKNLLVLLVEDHDDTRSTLSRLFRYLGHTVHEAHDGAEAILLAERSQYDLLICDIGLGKGPTGYDVMREISRRQSHPPGIAITGYAYLEDAYAALTAGFAVHVAKPASIDQIVEAINRATDHSGTLHETTRIAV